MSVDEKDWEQFKEKLFKKSGIDLNLYKEAQMRRRIDNLMGRSNTKGYVVFFNKIENSKEDYQSFIEYLTINVTEFFRTPNKFNELEDVVIRELLKASPKLNVWSAGCSIGAEPYSLAMGLTEITPTVRHRILATDLDSEMLNRARKAIYDGNDIKNIAPDRLKKYFEKLPNDKYQLNSDIKAKVEFKQHNLLNDRFESGFDLILCRNVVIYFTDEAKTQLYTGFFKALKPGGVLFVGGTESILNYKEIGYVQYRPFFYRKPN